MVPPDAPAPLAADQVISGRYRMVSPIARGGMAEVWEGYDEFLSRPVAVKVLQRQYADDEVFLERFRREAVAAARLAHPNLVAAFDAGADGPTTYMVMELVRGRTLRERMAEQGPFPPALAMTIAYQVTDALVHAHRAGIIHRDIKPANILLDESRAEVQAKVADFGIAKAAVGLGLDLTNTGMVLGTPRYLSPEQVEGKEPDGRADLYALGVICFEMLTGRSPFGGETEMAMAIARLNRAAPRVRDLQPKTPHYVDHLVAELLATDPRRRTPSALVLRQKLTEVRHRLAGGEAPGLLPRATALGSRWRARRAAPPAEPRRSPPPVGPGVLPFPPAAADAAAYAGTEADGAGGANSAEGGGGSALAGAVGIPDGGPAPRDPRVGTGNGRPAPPDPPVGTGGGREAPPEARVGTGGGQVGPPEGRVQPAPRPAPPVKADRAAPARPPVPSAPPALRSGSPGDPARRGPAPGPPPPPIAPPRQPPAVRPTGVEPIGVLDYGVPGTGQSGAPPSRWRLRRGPGVVVAAVVVIALIVAALLLSRGNPRSGGPSIVAPLSIASVSVWIVPPQHYPDNVSQAANTFDGNPKTQWQSQVYSCSPDREVDFCGYGGEGLAIELKSPATVHSLTVTSYTNGWAGRTYVAGSKAGTLAGWGPPTASHTGINGSTTFDLGGHHGRWVLLWLTNPGRTDQVGIAEVSIS